MNDIPSKKPPATPPAEDQAHETADALSFADFVSGEFDADQEQPADEAQGKRVLRPQADAPKLHKVLAQAGLGSRLEMERMIADGRISVNGEPAHVGQRIQQSDQIKLDGRPIRMRIAPQAPRVLAYHKPAGEVVTHDDPQNRPTVFRRLPRLQTGKWQSVGRLDLNTEGLLLFTNSGELANKLMHPRFGLQREYAVRVLGALSNEEKKRLLEGVNLDDGPAQFDSIEDGGGEGANCWYRVTISEGRNREVRRMFEAVGHAVSRLIRIRYGAVVLPRGLRRGVWTELDHRDIERLTLAVGMQRSDDDAERAAQRANRAPQRRNKGTGPRPSAPKLVEGPAVSRSTGRAIGRFRADEGRQDEGRAAGPRAGQPRGSSYDQPRGQGQHGAQSGYIGADANSRPRKGQGGAPGARKGPRR